MTPSILKPCAQPGCAALVLKGRCPTHQLVRPTSTARGFGRAHQALRARVFAEEPTCRHCGADGHPSDHADHIVPTRQGGPNTRENLQRLCHACHSRKTLREPGSPRGFEPR